MHARTNTFHGLMGCLTFLAGALLTLGCDYAGIPVIDNAPVGTPRLGTVCSLSTDTFSPTSVTLETESAVCPSRLCLRPNEQVATDTAALCTQACNDDSDCQGGVSRNGDEATDRSCAGGFACRIPIPGLAVAYACRKLCVCKDFLDASEPATAPAGCP